MIIIIIRCQEGVVILVKSYCQSILSLLFYRNSFIIPISIIYPTAASTRVCSRHQLLIPLTTPCINPILQSEKCLWRHIKTLLQLHYCISKFSAQPIRPPFYLVFCSVASRFCVVRVLLNIISHLCALKIVTIVCRNRFEGCLYVLGRRSIFHPPAVASCQNIAVLFNVARVTGYSIIITSREDLLQKFTIASKRVTLLRRERERYSIRDALHFVSFCQETRRLCDKRWMIRQNSTQKETTIANSNN